MFSVCLEVFQLKDSHAQREEQQMCFSIRPCISRSLNFSGSAPLLHSQDSAVGIIATGYRLDIQGVRV
jgi:hypothetical protein